MHVGDVGPPAGQYQTFPKVVPGYVPHLFQSLLKAGKAASSPPVLIPFLSMALWNLWSGPWMAPLYGWTVHLVPRTPMHTIKHILCRTAEVSLGHVVHPLTTGENEAVSP